MYKFSTILVLLALNGALFGQDPCAGLDAGFSWATTPNGTVFSNATAGTGFQTSWAWTFGDGSTSDLPQPFHTYQAPGTYQVCLVVTSLFETVSGVVTCLDDVCETVVIEGAGSVCDGLDAGFSWTTTPNGTAFSNATVGTGFQTSWAWTFGDGGTSDLPQPFHTYQAPGTYQVCLVVTSLFETASGVVTCLDDVCETVVIEGAGSVCDGLDAGFSWTTTPNGTVFSNATVGTGFQTSWAWTFGDGGTSDLPQPFHTYQEPGTYQVCLVVTSLFETASGVVTCLDDVCETVVVMEVDPCAGIEACFLPSQLSSTAFFFNNCTSSLPPALPQMVWLFGDGTTSTEFAPIHAFPGPGTYNVCLVATWQDCVDEYCSTVIVGGGDPCDELTACFDALPFENGAYYFENCSTYPVGAQFLWDLGDGTSATSLNAEHVYQPGTYEVCLTVFWEQCEETICVPITVAPGPGCDPSFAATFDWFGQGTVVVFTGTANLPVNGFIWHFGDGSEGAGAIVTHLYEPPGPFEVCLDAWYWNEVTEDTCWTEYCLPIDPFDMVNAVGTMDSDRVGIYPVPAYDRVSISGLPDRCTVRLIANDGRIVAEDRATSGMHSMSVADLASGTYILRIDHDAGTMFGQIAVE